MFMQLLIFRYSVYEDVTIFISTFNVNGKPPPSSFPTWLSYKGRAPDFYAIGYGIFIVQFPLYLRL